MAMPDRSRPRRHGVSADVADRLVAALADGTYAVGERMPSIRRLSRDWAVSITAVVAAYARLEDRGLIRRAPRSGLFALRQPSEPRELAVSRPASDPTTVSMGDLALEVLRTNGRDDMVAFGSALIDSSLLPTRELAARIAQATRRPATEWIGYADPSGLPALRTHIARRTQAMNCAIAPDDVMVTTGAMEAITLALRATCRAGDVVAIESPVYFGILQLIESLGLRVVEIPTHPRTGMQLESLREAVDEHPVRAVMAITNFSNPLGCRMPDDAKQELVELLAERGIPLIEDDIYGDLAHDGTRPGVAKAYDREGLVLLCSSFSKCLSSGLRVGWIAGGRFADRIRQLKLSSSIASATLPQIAVAEHLASGGYERHLRRLRAACAERCTALSQRIAASFPASTRVSRPAGGYMLWIELPHRSNALELYRLATADRIAIAPGHLFSAKPRYRHFIRLNAAAYRAIHDPAIVQLGRLAAHLAR